MDPKLMCKCGILSLLMTLAATAQDIVIKPKDPAAAEDKILEIFESDTDGDPPVPNSKPGANLKPLDRN